MISIETIMTCLQKRYISFVLLQLKPYGTVAVFEDLFGNLWDLIEPK